MSEFMKSIGHKVRSSFSRLNGVSEEEFLSQSVDRIDLEMSMREFDRHRSTSRRVLGGSCRL